MLIVVLGAYAGWNGWNWWQRDQAVKAGAMFDELDSAAQAGDADRAGRVFADMKERFPRTAFAQQGGLLAAKVAFDKGQLDAARAELTWVAEQRERRASTRRSRGCAWPALLLDEKKYDEALKQLDGGDRDGVRRRWSTTAAATSAGRRASRTRPRPRTGRPGPRSTRRSTTAAWSRPS